MVLRKSKNSIRGGLFRIIASVVCLLSVTLLSCSKDENDSACGELSGKVIANQSSQNACISACQQKAQAEGATYGTVVKAYYCSADNKCSCQW